MEIWRIHPLDRTLIAWQCQPDGTYQESHSSGGTVQPIDVERPEVLEVQSLRVLERTVAQSHVGERERSDACRDSDRGLAPSRRRSRGKRQQRHDRDQ